MPMTRSCDTDSFQVERVQDERQRQTERERDRTSKRFRNEVVRKHLKTLDLSEEEESEDLFICVSVDDDCR